MPDPSSIVEEFDSQLSSSLLFGKKEDAFKYSTMESGGMKQQKMGAGGVLEVTTKGMVES